MPEFEQKIKNVALAEELSTRYLSYAMSTIVDRALPDVRDGLKPVHRRLLFAMRQLHLDPKSGFKNAPALSATSSVSITPTAILRYTAPCAVWHRIFPSVILWWTDRAILATSTEIIPRPCVIPKRG